MGTKSPVMTDREPLISGWAKVRLIADALETLARVGQRVEDGLKLGGTLDRLATALEREIASDGRRKR